MLHWISCAATVFNVALHRYPSHARMWIAPMQTTLGERKVQEYEHSMGDWNRFTQETSDQYGVNMNVLTAPYREEQRKYFLQVQPS